MNCTRCDGTGFLNLDQLEAAILERFNSTGDRQVILDWIDRQAAKMIRVRCKCDYCRLQHDVQVCDCCGDGESWHGEPGRHAPGEPCECS